MQKNWQDLTLGDCYRLTLAKLRQLKRTVNFYSPIKVDTDATKRLLGVLASAVMAPVLYALDGIRPKGFLPEGLDRPLEPAKPKKKKAIAPTTKKRPWHQRTEDVNRVLQAAWQSGKRSYRQLMAEVKEMTGMGCSRSTVARFVKTVKG